MKVLHRSHWSRYSWFAIALRMSLFINATRRKENSEHVNNC